MVHILTYVHQNYLFMPTWHNAAVILQILPNISLHSIISSKPCKTSAKTLRPICRGWSWRREHGIGIHIKNWRQLSNASDSVTMAHYLSNLMMKSPMSLSRMRGETKYEGLGAILRMVGKYNEMQTTL